MPSRLAALVLLLTGVGIAFALWMFWSAFQDMLANEDYADRCISQGYVYLSGSGVSEHGCYDLKRVNP